MRADVKRNLLVLVVIFVAVAAMLSYGMRRAPSGGNVAAHVGAAVGNFAPNFRLADVRTGKTVELSDFKGKAVVVNFWATWCPPCKVEIPWFIAMQKIHAGDGLQVIGVAMDDAGSGPIAKFADDLNVNYPVVQGTEKVADLYGGVDGLPTTFYIGRDGRVFKQVIGEPSRGDVENTVKAILRSGERAVSQTAAK
jgi:cytochrome c biogenesis protein CcmG/thiol:disulfide interchange protein DsbE